MSQTIDKSALPDDDNRHVAQFYESKFLSLNKQTYQAISKAALFFDEVITVVANGIRFSVF